MSPDYANTELQAANDKYAPTYTAGNLPAMPLKHIALLTCMDARLCPEQFAGFKLGECHMIRNGGGRAVDAVRSLVVSQEMLNTREIIVVHHTDCGFTKVDHELFQQKIRARTPPGVHALAQAIAPLEITDPRQSVQDDIQFLRAHPLIFPETNISGWVFHTDTGKLEKIATA